MPQTPKFTLISWVLCVFLLSHCKSQQGASQSKTATKRTQTDFSSIRPRFDTGENGTDIQEVPPKMSPKDNPEQAITSTKKEFKHPLEISQESLWLALDSMTSFNTHIKLAQGYRINLYNGSDKEQMNRIKSKVYTLFPDAQLYSTYRQPTFILRMGDYLDRFDAEVDRVKLKRAVPSAVIVEDRINIRKQH